MEQEYILSVGEGEGTEKYLIDQVIQMDGKCYFTLVNLQTFDFMFGEFSGATTEDADRNRQLIYRDFLSGCPHISYPDGYIVDDLYGMMDPFMMDSF